MRDSHNKQLTPQDTLRIYALKTAPAFEAALHTGLRLAGPTEHYLQPIAQFARDLGIAFQIINDLNDWIGDNHNKLRAAGDVIGGRPTLQWALALEGLATDKCSRLEKLAGEVPRLTKNCAKFANCTKKLARSKKPTSWWKCINSEPRAWPPRSNLSRCNACFSI